MTRADPTTPDPSPVPSPCDVTETLFADYGAELTLPVIAAVVRQTHLDLPTTGDTTDLEISARARLTALAAEQKLL